MTMAARASVRSNLQRLATGWLGALMVILAVTGFLERQQKTLSLSAFDQPFYLGIADDLLVAHRFTNGFMFDTHGPAAVRGEGMRFSPLYPAMLAAAAAVDSALRAGMDCVVATADLSGACGSAPPVMRVLQFAMLAGFFLMVWWIGKLCGAACGAPCGIAWVSLALALIAAPNLLRYVNLMMTEITCLSFATGAICAWLRSQVGGRPMLWALAAGVLLGLTALTRPGFLYLIPFCVISGFIAAAIKRTSKDFSRVFWFAAGGAGALAPWIVRNMVVMGRASLTYGYDSHTLVQRIAFDTMTWREYGLSYVCWLPDGTSLGRRFVGVGACDRFGWDEQPNSFYSLGLRHMLDDTLRAAGGYDHHLSYLLHTYILAMPLWHIAVSIPLALRGAYISHWWGLVLLPVCLVMTAKSAWRGREQYLAVSLPAFFMLAFNAGVAVNQVRYNLLLVPAYSVAGAFFLYGLPVSGWAQHPWLSRFAINRHAILGADKR